MKIAIAADHAGFELKETLKKELAGQGHQVDDLGTCSTEPVDYPDFAAAAAKAVQSGRVPRSILICGSGVGASIAANKFKGIRAGLCHDTYSAHQGVEHDDMNILVMGSRVIGSALALEISRAFLNASFSGEPRHERRLRKVLDLEKIREI